MDPSYLVPPPTTLPAPLDWLAVLWALLFGGSVGSFLNVVIARVPEGISIVSPRSRCPRCESEIAWYDNIPLLSWVLLRARCRGCGLPISARYPLVELLIALAAVALFVRGGVSVDSVEGFVFVTLLVAIAFIDLDTKTIPLSLLGLLLANAVIATCVAWFVNGKLTGPWWVATDLRETGFEGLIERAVGFGVGFGILAAVVVIGTAVLRRTGRIGPDHTAMGWGDPVLLGVIGSTLGWRAIPLVLFLGSFQGVIVGVVMLRFGPDASNDDVAAADDEDEEEDEDDGTPAGAIPFGPFLAMGALEVAFFGDAILRLISGLVSQ